MVGKAAIPQQYQHTTTHNNTKFIQWKGYSWYQSWQQQDDPTSSSCGYKETKVINMICKAALMEDEVDKGGLFETNL